MDEVELLLSGCLPSRVTRDYPSRRGDRTKIVPYMAMNRSTLGDRDD